MRRSVSILALCATILAVGCKKPAPPPPPPPPATPVVKVQVISVDPNRVTAGEPALAQVFGSGFSEGAEVYVDMTRIASADRLDSNTIEISLPPLQAGPHDIRVKNPDGTSHALRAAVVAMSASPPPPPDPTATLGCEDITVNFGFDSSSLSRDATRVLDEHLLCFTARSGTVRIEGHTDERGTTAYNLALGQRRADAVRRWLAAKGVPASRIQTVSFGEERPAARGGSESAWARNRRAEISAKK